MKFRSKVEIYRFLTVEVKAYVGKYKTMTIWHLRDLAFGSRQMILQRDVQTIAVPFFKNLSIDLMLKFARNYPDAMNALPIEEEIDKLHRQYVANVIFTTVGNPF